MKKMFFYSFLHLITMYKRVIIDIISILLLFINNTLIYLSNKAI